MKELLKWNQRSLQSVAIGPVMALLLFAFVFFAEIFIYALAFIAIEPFKANTVLYNGLSTVLTMLAKILALVLVYRLVILPKTLYVTGEERPKVFKYELESPFKQLGLKLWLFLFSIFLSYRLGYDSYLTGLTVQQFGIDPNLVEGFEKMLTVPALGLIAIVIAAPVLEEFFYRGVLFSGLLKKGWSFIPAALLSAGLFALMHLNWAQGINAFFIGLIAAGLYYLTGDLRLPILFHLINNLFVSLWSAYTDAFLRDLSTLPALGLTAVGFGILGLLFVQFEHTCKKAAPTNV